jgi:hypothetical protein
MSRTSIKKFSVVAGLFSFTLIFFGSWIYGARVFSSFFRGLEGFVIFGLLTWSVLRGWAAMKPEERLEGGKDKKGVNLDQTV